MAQDTESQIVKSFRELQGLSLRAFAVKLGVSHNAVRQWELGISRVNPDYLTEWDTSTDPDVLEFSRIIREAKLSGLRKQIRDLKPIGS